MCTLSHNAHSNYLIRSIPAIQYRASAVQTERKVNDDEPPGRCFNIVAICRNQQCTGGMCNHLTPPPSFT